MPPPERGEEMNGSHSGLPENPDKGIGSESPPIQKSVDVIVTDDRQRHVTAKA
jgi:hypothetical protein